MFVSDFPMKTSLKKNSVVVRSAWFTVAFFLLVFCGPVKRLIEYKVSKTTPTAFLHGIDKQLHTSYREKRDIQPLISTATHQSPDTGLTFFTAAAFVLLVLHPRTGLSQKLKYKLQLLLQYSSLYLLFRRLQV